MMDISIYFQPIDHVSDDYSKGQWGKEIQVHSVEEGFPDCEKAKVAIIGVLDGRQVFDNDGIEKGADEIRKHLYTLYQSGNKVEVVDLGNILPGESIKDTYYAVSQCVEILVKKEIIPVIIGGGNDLLYPQFIGYEKLEQLVNVVAIDNQFDMAEDVDQNLSSRTALSGIMLHQPSYLFNYSNLGYQSYFIDPDVLDLMTQLYFDNLRLGKLREDLKKSEPFLRNADIVAFDIGAIKSSDAPGNRNAVPNGLYGEEACQLSWYSGMSDKVSSFGIYEYNPTLDHNGQTAQLISQIVWYFVEGVGSRKDDYPSDNESHYLKYRVHIEELSEEIVFYKSLKTDRWWMNVPVPGGRSNKYKRHQMVPCSYSDYLEACEDEMPELWLKTFKKLL